MNKLQVGNITFERVVVKDDDYLDRHEMSLLSLILRKHLRKDRAKLIRFLEKIILTSNTEKA